MLVMGVSVQCCGSAAVHSSDRLLCQKRYIILRNKDVINIVFKMIRVCFATVLRAAAEPTAPLSPPTVSPNTTKEFRSLLKAIDRDAAHVIKEANESVFARVSEFVHAHVVRMRASIYVHVGQPCIDRSVRSSYCYLCRCLLAYPNSCRCMPSARMRAQAFPRVCCCLA